MMNLPDVFVVFILLVGASALGFLVAWLVRQSRIDKLQDLIHSLEADRTISDAQVKKFEKEKEGLREEIAKYKDLYNGQLSQNQKLVTRLEQSEREVTELQAKIQHLTEMLLQATAQLESLQSDLASHPKSAGRVISERRIVRPRQETREFLTLIDKSGKPRPGSPEKA